MRIYVISSGRPHHVEWMARFHDDLMWTVPIGQVGDYMRMGARQMIATDAEPPCKWAQQNDALGHAWAAGEWAILCDDDLTAVEQVDLERAKASPTTLENAAAEIIVALRETGMFLGGPGPYENLSWRKVPVRRTGLVRGALHVHRRGSPCRYDEQAQMSDDADMSVQHHVTHGGVAIADTIRVSARYEFDPKGQLAGGFAGGLRSPQAAQAAVLYLNSKWGHDWWHLSERGTASARVPWMRVAAQATIGP